MTLGQWVLIGVLTVVVGFPALYIVARIATLAYFKSKGEYEQDRKRKG